MCGCVESLGTDGMNLLATLPVFIMANAPEIG